MPPLTHPQGMAAAAGTVEVPSVVGSADVKQLFPLKLRTKAGGPVVVAPRPLPPPLMTTALEGPGHTIARAWGGGWLNP